MLHKEVVKELKEKSAELAALYEVGKSLVDAKLKLEDMLHLITKHVASVSGAAGCLIYLMEENGNGLTLGALIGFKAGNASQGKLSGSIKNIAKLVAKAKKILKIEDLYKHPKSKNFFAEKKQLWRSLLAIPLKKRGEVVGVLVIFYSKQKKFTKDIEKMLILFGNQCSMAIENAKLFEKTRTNYLNTVKVLASIIDAKDSYTSKHSESVMKSALAIAKEMKLSEHQMEIIKYASFLHDIGKIAVDVGVLRKASRLSQDEWNEVIQHPKFGAELIRRIGFLDDLVPTILYHHARYSGGGYPDPEKKQEGIPIEARILAVADSYEAMISDRPYRRALSKEQAIQELEKCAGTQFDPKIVEIFLNFLKRKASVK